MLLVLICLGNHFRASMPINQVEFVDIFNVKRSDCIDIKEGIVTLKIFTFWWGSQIEIYLLYSLFFITLETHSVIFNVLLIQHLIKYFTISFRIKIYLGTFLINGSFLIQSKRFQIRRTMLALAGNRMIMQLNTSTFSLGSLPIFLDCCHLDNFNSFFEKFPSDHSKCSKEGKKICIYLWKL